MVKFNAVLGVVCSLLLMGCSEKPVIHEDQSTVSMNSSAPTTPNINNFVSPRTSLDYHTGMLRYRDALLRYQLLLTRYIEDITISEGFVNVKGQSCVLPFGWTPMVLPATPEPISTDHSVVTSLLVAHIRALRDIINSKNKEYLPCVK